MGLDNICTKQISSPLSSCLVSVPTAPLPPNPTLLFNRQVWRTVTALPTTLQLLRSLCPLGAGEGSGLALQWPHKPERKSCDLVVL